MMDGLELIAYSIGETVSSVFGKEPIAVSLFIILFFLLLIVFTGLDLTVGLLIMIPLIVFLTAYGGFPAWITFIMVMGMALVYYFALKQAFNR